MPEEPLLPELARSLRALGNLRDAHDVEAHEAIFVPLMEARARATGSSREAVLGAIHGSVLAARIQAQVVAAAARGAEPPARARALTAHARERIAPLLASFSALDDVAVDAASDNDAWERWVVALRRVFTAADVACRDLAAVLVLRDVREKPPRWYARSDG